MPIGGVMKLKTYLFVILFIVTGSLTSIPGAYGYDQPGTSGTILIGRKQEVNTRGFMLKYTWTRKRKL